MQKKVFLQKGKGGGGRPPYVKYLLWAALGLILLVIVTPYMLSPKGKDVARRPLQEKGAVKKELPKPPEPAPVEPPPSERIPGGLAAKPEPVPEPPKPPEPAPAIEPSPPPVPPATPLPAPVPTAPAPTPLVPEQPPVTKPPAPAPKDQVLFPKTPSTAPKAPAPSARAPEAAKKPPQPGAPAAAAKQPPAAPAGKGYSIQLGCYRDKQAAEEVRRSLQKKGYEVDICSVPAGSNSYAYTVVTKPVASMSRAATLVEQIKQEPKVSPTILKGPPVCTLDAKPAATVKMPPKAAMKRAVIEPSAKKPAGSTSAAGKNTVPAKKPQPTKTSNP